MGMFETIKEQAVSSLSNWIEVYDNKSKYTIEDFPVGEGVDESKINYKHCWKCVTVNKCWFKNETDKKPQELNDIFGLGYKIAGLYHPHCHCKELSIVEPTLVDKKFVAVEGKVDFFFKDKIQWYYAWGYKDEDKLDFVELVLNLSYQGYCLGNYEVAGHDKAGFRINVFVDLPGRGQKEGKKYKIKTCWMIYPLGTLKCNTLVGGRAK